MKLLCYENTHLCRLSVSADTGNRTELLFSVDYEDSEGSAKLSREKAFELKNDVVKLLEEKYLKKVK